jgi:hypothetical protein
MSDEKGNLKIMPKLIIPNAYELYQSDNHLLTRKEIRARYFYNLRFLWLLEAGDAIILPQKPAKGFLSYLAKIKQIDPEELHLIILEKKYTSLHSGVFSDPKLIKQLREIMTIPSQWKIQSCFFNLEILALAKKLRLKIDPEWSMFIKSKLSKHVNSKAEFRKISQSHAIPIPEGLICSTAKELEISLENFLKITGQVIIKQEYNASGKGNIGVAVDESPNLVGVSNTIIIKKNECIKKIAKQIWLAQIDSWNKVLIVEVYYPNKGTFTAQFFVPPQGEPLLVNYSEIIMESRWVGIQIPPGILLCMEANFLVTCSRKFANSLQNRGYQGYLCCDAILTNERKIIFTEINVRPGAETHAYILARHLFGEGYENSRVILTGSCHINKNSFLEIHEKLNEKNLLISNQQNDGVALLTVGEGFTHQLEYLIAAPDLVGAYALESKMGDVLGTKQSPVSACSF